MDPSSNVSNILSAAVNRGRKAGEDFLKEVTSNSSTVKKTIILSRKLVNAYDLCTSGVIKDREYTKLAKEVTNLMGFYGTYKNILLWTNPFSKKSFDEKTFSKSLAEALNKQKRSPFHSSLNTGVVTKQAIDHIMQEKKEYKEKAEITSELKKILRAQGFLYAEREAILKEVVIEQEARPIITILSRICGTIESVGGSILHLQEWNIIDLSGIVASVGNKCPVLKIVMSAGAGVLLDLIGSAGLVLALGQGIYKGVNILILYQEANEAEKEKLGQELKKLGFELFTGTCELVYTLAPIFLSVSPPVLITLAILAKGTGLINVFVQME